MHIDDSQQQLQAFVKAVHALLEANATSSRSQHAQREASVSTLQQSAPSPPQQLRMYKGMVLMRGLTEGRRVSIQEGDMWFSPWPGDLASDGNPAGKHISHWQRKDGLRNVVVEVSPGQSASCRQVANKGEWMGVEDGGQVTFKSRHRGLYPRGARGSMGTHGPTKASPRGGESPRRTDRPRGGIVDCAHQAVPCL